jgi:hypothetical protein
MAMKQSEIDALNESIEALDRSKVKFKGLTYGESGVGKTILNLDLAQRITPPDKRILYVDTGEGWVSALNHPQLKKRVQRMVYKGMKQFSVLVQAIQEDVPGFDDYGSIIFDEFSTSAKKFLHVVLDANQVDRMKEAPEFKHWGIMSRNIESTVWDLLKLKETHHLFFIAHERVRENKRTKIEITRPAFMDSIEGTVKNDMHVVARMTASVSNATGAPQYVRDLQCHPTKMVIAKSRIGGLDIKVSPSKFTQRIVEWMDSGELVDEQEVVELAEEQTVTGDFSDQSDFTGFESED